MEGRKGTSPRVWEKTWELRQLVTRGNFPARVGETPNQDDYVSRSRELPRACGRNGKALADKRRLVGNFPARVGETLPDQRKQ